jgi:hypothetical protein
MRKLTQIGIGAAIVVAIAGGSFAAYATANTDVTATDSPTDTGTATDVATSTPAADDTTPTPTATPWPYTEVADADTIFLKAMHADGFLNGITIPADDELIRWQLALAMTRCKSSRTTPAPQQTSLVRLLNRTTQPWAASPRRPTARSTR